MERHAGTQGTLPDVDAGSVTVPLIIHIGLGTIYITYVYIYQCLNRRE